MREIFLDGRRMTSRESAHQQLAQSLDFPPYYGRNLDALHDCLGDIGSPTLLVLRHAARMKEGLGGYGVALLRVMEDAERENENLSLLVLEA